MRFLSMVLGALLLGATGSGGDSLFSQKDAKEGTLISEKTARFEMGDIITVQVQEVIEASTAADTNTKKESDVESEAGENENSFWVHKDGLNLINPEELPNWGIESENETKTTGTTRRQSELSTTITCTVENVYPNGNLFISGRRVVTINREDSTLVVSGVVRSKDVTPANTVLSTQMANASVQLQGKGPLWNNQRRGLVTRFLDWFSPF